jgi:ribosomal-protein-serine acetyltransferase
LLSIPPRAELHQRPIETSRLRLFPVDVNDGQDLWYAVQGSRAELKRWLPWVEYHTDPPSSARFAEACASDWDQGRAVRFVLRDRERHTLLGIVGLEQCVHLHRSCELGYWLRNEATGRGLMTEAARACVDFAFRRMAAHRVRVAAGTANHASLAVIRRLGFHFEGIAREAEWCDGRWIDHAVFGRLSTDP